MSIAWLLLQPYDGLFIYAFLTVFDFRMNNPTTNNTKPAGRLIHTALVKPAIIYATKLPNTRPTDASQSANACIKLTPSKKPPTKIPINSELYTSLPSTL